MADKRGRIQELIQRNVSEIIIYGLKNDLCSLASVHEVRLSPDYSWAKIYVSHVDPEKADELVEFLNSKASYIRSRLAGKLDIYKTPELRFEKDTLYEYSLKMENLIDKAVNSKPVTLASLDDEDEGEDD